VFVGKNRSGTFCQGGVRYGGEKSLYINNKLGGKKPHKTKSQRKIIIIQEWAYLLGVTRPAIYRHNREAYDRYRTTDRLCRASRAHIGRDRKPQGRAEGPEGRDQVVWLQCSGA